MEDMLSPSYWSNYPGPATIPLFNTMTREE